MRESVRQLLILVAIVVIGYRCMYILRFSVGALNSIFACAYFVVPFLAIRPVLRLRRRLRNLVWILLVPVLFLSVGGIVVRLNSLVSAGRGRPDEIYQPLQVIQQGNSTIELGRYHNGGAVGVLGVYLEQRRLIVPGLYLVRSLDWFDHEKEASLSVEGRYRVRVHAKGNYYSNDFAVDRTYAMKPWLYF